MKNSLWAKFPYRWTLYVRVRPTAIARYVDDQVNVDVVIETRSSVSLTSSFSPLNRLSRLNPTMNSMNRGDTAMAIDLNQLSGTSSNSILTARNPPEMDSMTCSSQTMSLGMFPPTRESTRLSRPQPFSRPMLASRIMSRARMALRSSRPRAFHLLSCVSNTSVT